MRILIFSDTHGDINKCIETIDKIPADAIVHLGDIMRDVGDLAALYPDKPLYYVAGNNDFGAEPATRVVTIGGISLFLAHGHTFGVHYGTRRLLAAAKEAGAAVVLYGHTHVAETATEDGIYLMNPGSPSRPRDGSPSCGIIEIENGKIGMAIYPV